MHGQFLLRKQTNKQKQVVGIWLYPQRIPTVQTGLNYFWGQNEDLASHK